jgi:hypothetical protein
MKLSEYDQVHCLFVDRRIKEEQDRIFDMLIEKGVESKKIKPFMDGLGKIFHPAHYQQISPTPPSSWQHGPGAYAHFMGMQAIIERAKADRSVEHILFVEDDCVFTDEFDDVVESATQQLVGHDWDILYYGANHTWARTGIISENVLQCFGSYTTHCLGIKRRMFNSLLRLQPYHVIDKVIADTIHPTHKCYAVWPNVAIQKPGYSYLSYQEMDYTDYFKSKGMNH